MDVLLVDAGILGEPLAEPDVTRHEVAAAVGADAKALADAAIGLRRSTRWPAARRRSCGGLHAEGRVDAIGGTRRNGRHDDRHARDAGVARRRAEADGLDRRVGRYELLRRLRRT